ncbi:MAG: leucine-rich repeat domain-containing protein, partial [Bacteroidetes bacterium]|nr:leucine-rich repeat domain-containing protein [Bacteroidota bacterium]
MSISQLPSQLTTKVPNLIPSDETHLPLYLHIQRFLVTNEGKEGLYHIEDGKLVALNLSGMNLEDHDLDFLANCPDLQSINLSGNAFTRLEFPNNLPNLEYINISKNPELKTLTFSRDLPNLRRMYAGYGGIESITFADGFNNLELIELQENKLSKLELPQGMETLRFLDLSENKLERLSGRGNYEGLRTLYLENNRLTENKKDFLTPFPKLVHLRLDGNPLHEAVLSNISDSSTGTLAFIRRYITDLAGDSELDKETKVLLLGNGNVGKTCLVRRMVNNEFVKEWKSTHAISLDKYPINHEDDSEENLVHPYILNLWDFGGQDLYHATHRLFMQHNAVYLILWDNKTENLPETIRIEQKEERSYKNHFLQYWLAYAESQGKSHDRDSPVIVVQTKTRRDGKVDKPEIREVFGPRFSFLEFAHIESEENDWSENGYEDLMYQIKKAVRKVKTKAEIPVYWTDIRRKIRAIQKAGKQDYMEMPDFYQLAEKVEDPMDVLNWLTQSGVVFYQKGLFNDEIILNQAWAIEAIYTLFDRDKVYYSFLQKNDRGEFSGRDLSMIWTQNSEAEKELFVSFMLSCEMCFEATPKDERRYHIPFEERTFVAPQLLKPKTDQVELVWRKETLFFIRFEHDFLHDGVIQRFIVRAQEIAKVEQMWFRGILLTEGDEMVQVEAWEKLVLVKATLNANRLLAKIRKELSEVQGDD